MTGQLNGNIFEPKEPQTKVVYALMLVLVHVLVLWKNRTVCTDFELMCINELYWLLHY